MCFGRDHQSQGPREDQPGRFSRGIAAQRPITGAHASQGRPSWLNQSVLGERLGLQTSVRLLIGLRWPPFLTDILKGEAALITID